MPSAAASFSRVPGSDWPRRARSGRADRRLTVLRAASSSSVHRRRARAARTRAAISAATLSWPALHDQCIIVRYHGASSEVEPETWAVMAGRRRIDAGAPLNVPPVLASNFELGARAGLQPRRRDADVGGVRGAPRRPGGRRRRRVRLGHGARPQRCSTCCRSAPPSCCPDDCYQGVAGLAAAGAAAGPMGRGPRRRRGHRSAGSSSPPTPTCCGWSRRRTRC